MRGVRNEMFRQKCICGSTIFSFHHSTNFICYENDWELIASSSTDDEDILNSLIVLPKQFEPAVRLYVDGVVPEDVTCTTLICILEFCQYSGLDWHYMITKQTLVDKFGNLNDMSWRTRMPGVGSILVECNGGDWYAHAVSYGCL